MPVFNEEKFIEDAIKSVIEQNYTNFELIIVNDGSTDSTEDIINRYLSNNHIRYFSNGKIGKNNAINLAYKNSSGDYFCFMGGDDLLPSDSLLNRIEPIKELNNVVSACKIKMTSIFKKFNNVITPKNPNKGAFLGGTLLFDKTLAEKIFPIPSTLANEDKWTVEIINHFCENIIHIPEPFYYYRIHENGDSKRFANFTEKSKAMHKRFIVYSIFLEKFRNNLNELQIKKLSALSVAETLRFNNQWFLLFFLKGLSISDKIRYIFHSNRLLYWIRMQMFSFFSGRT